MGSFYLQNLVFCLFFSFSTAFNCSTPPIYIDIHSRIVHGSPIFQYGSFIGVGSPAQNQSIFPSLRHNETSVASVSFCASSNLTDCSQSTHGNFDPIESSTFAPDGNYQSSDINGVAMKAQTGRDNIHLYTHFFETDPAFEHVAFNTPVSVALNGSTNPGVVGLGSSSTLLHTLFDQGTIAARTFGLYIGSGMTRANGAVNGSLVLGGYDSGRFTGSVHSYAISQLQDPFTIGVVDVIVDNPSGERNVSLFNTQRFPSGSVPAPFLARLSTDEYTISMPSSITQNFASLSGAVTSDQYSDGSLALNPSANGMTMTIVLSDGYRVTLPQEVIFNVSGISPIANRDEKSRAPFTLGLSFLSQVYLAVDYDNYMFHLADAVQKNYIMPQTFCPKSTPRPYVPSKRNYFLDTGLLGAVVGGVIGGLVILSVLSMLLLTLRRKNRERKAAKAAKELATRSDGKTMVGQDSDVESQKSTHGIFDRWRKR